MANRRALVDIETDALLALVKKEDQDGKNGKIKVGVSKK